MLPAAAYTSAEVLAWERRHLFAGTWTCLGRVDDLLADARRRRQRAVDRSATSRLLLVRDGGAGPDVRQHLPAPRPRAAARGRVRRTGGAIVCPYHAWTYDLDGSLMARARASATSTGFDAAEHGLVELPVEVWHGLGVRARPAPAGQRRRCRRSTSTSATWPASWRRTRPGTLVRRRPAHLRGRGQLEGDRRELPRVLPLPADPPGAVPGHPAGLAATTTTCPAPGSAARWTCATAWRRCR